MKQEKFIEVYDDIINPDLVNYLEHLALSQPIPYVYVQNIAFGKLEIGDTYQPGFNHLFFKNEINHINKDTIFQFNQILYNFCQFRKINIFDIIAGRVFLHIPSPNSTPNEIHIDSSTPHWVCLYYLTDSDGDTILYEDDEITEIKRVSPKKGRIVFFDGSIKHCSSSPTTNHRAIVNFDFIGEFLDKQK